MYLEHYSDFNADCRNQSLLSINCFQKDLAATNQLIRALALRVLTSIRVLDIIQIQMITVKKCSRDNSPYVRKAAAHAVTKIWQMDKSPEQKEALADILDILLNDTQTLVLGSAVAALNEVCPERLDLLHKPYRKICHLLADIDEWGQITTMGVLMRYARQQFLDPCPESANTKDEDKPTEENRPKRRRRKRIKKAFYSDEEDEEYSVSEDDEPKETPALGGNAGPLGPLDDLDPDHKLLLKCSIPLLKSRNSGVVLAVVTLHFNCGPANSGTSQLLGKALVRILRNHKEIQYVVLNVIADMAPHHQEMFQPFLENFFIKSTDPAYIRSLKLRILQELALEDAITPILKECQTYVRHADKNFVKATIRTVTAIADRSTHMRNQCLSGLMQMVGNRSEEVNGEAVVAVRQLLQKMKGAKEEKEAKKKAPKKKKKKKKKKKGSDSDSDSDTDSDDVSGSLSRSRLSNFWSCRMFVTTSTSRRSFESSQPC
jgi:AP-3 complex subunit beta